MEKREKRKEEKNTGEDADIPLRSKTPIGWRMELSTPCKAREVKGLGGDIVLEGRRSVRKKKTRKRGED